MINQVLYYFYLGTNIPLLWTGILDSSGLSHTLTRDLIAFLVRKATDVSRHSENVTYAGRVAFLLPPENLFSRSNIEEEDSCT